MQLWYLFLIYILQIKILFISFFHVESVREGFKNSSSVN